MAEATPPAWTVTAQVEEFQPNDRGQYVPGVTVSFRTAAGHNGSVFVPRTEYNPERARALIAERAATMDAIGALRG